MIIEIDLTQLNSEQLEELSQVINESIDYSIQTLHLARGPSSLLTNYEASQNIDHYMTYN